MQRYQNMVFSTAMRLLVSQTDAEDVTRKLSFAFEHFADLRESPTAGGWLKRVATNLSLNHLTRYRSRWSFFSEIFSGNSDDSSENPVEFAAPDDVQEQLEQADRHQLVERALAHLPAAQRVPLVLYHLEGLRYEEIAAKLNISLGKVKTDIFRAREALRRKLRFKLAEETF